MKMKTGNGSEMIVFQYLCEQAKKEKIEKLHGRMETL